MKGRENKTAPPADLLVCFPSRAHLTLMPKPICSPARPTESSKRRHHHHHHLTRSNRGGQASPLLWAKNKQQAGTEIAEPTSPKVTCAGQIKVRPKSSSKNWQSVMEEIERLHNSRKQKKKPTWLETLGFKKDIMQFLTCLRSLRFDLRCFGSFHGSDVTSDEEEDEEEEEEDQENQVSTQRSDGSGASRTIFSKWFMVLQENQNNTFSKEEKCGEERDLSCDEGSVAAPSAPPPNALLLMRCRSAPAKGWLEAKQREQEEEQDTVKKENLALEEERKKESLVLMSYAPDFFKISPDIAKETWVVGRMRDPLSRSRSWKR
ncbi:PREDICTED: uncharacterized protein LOC104600126 [Nelumbo nucifera]|uniref:Uncharacterized protein n=2 Tax=Nelumbo nucifera TaxID=4432 RepID=A0A822ZA46_NELNU|nr:PREDICTED: uncharacterized protein LOC104600126 [Nelumbo nucifera]DAD40315.1 TPA_asm: hypothetical protein HUJ06_014638 [Nelumbo nucifera]